MRIFLTGYSGSGKSTTGKKLASLLQLPFVDLDARIEEHFNMPVSLIFKNLGEPTFRNAEREILAQMAASRGRLLVACGGGAPCFFDNMEAMNHSGLTIYMKASPAFLASRIEQNSVHRPLLVDLRGDELVLYITQHLAERSAFYELAKLILPVPLRDFAKAAERIREAYLK